MITNASQLEEYSTRHVARTLERQGWEGKPFVPARSELDQEKEVSAKSKVPRRWRHVRFEILSSGSIKVRDSTAHIWPVFEGMGHAPVLAYCQPSKPPGGRLHPSLRVVQTGRLAILTAWPGDCCAGKTHLEQVLVDEQQHFDV